MKIVSDFCCAGNIVCEMINKNKKNSSVFEQKPRTKKNSICAKTFLLLLLFLEDDSFRFCFKQHSYPYLVLQTIRMRKHTQHLFLS